MKKGLIVNNVQKREVGGVSSRSFAHCVAASQELVVRFDISRKLVSHGGCVNTLDFNKGGNILASGSDDTRVILWDWETGRILVSCLSAHHNNVFQAKFMPFSEDRSLVTCAADGQVRHIQLLENGEVSSTFLAKHRGGAHKLAIEPGSPHNFYTCGEDGVVQHRDMGLGPNPTPAPNSGDITESSSNALADFSHVVPTVFKGHKNIETIKGVFFFGPKCEYVMSGSDCGRIFIWKKKDGELIRVMEADKHVVNCIEPHPHIPVLASSGIENDIKIWVPKAMERSILPTNMAVPARHHLFPFGFGDIRFDYDNGIYIFNNDDDDDDDEDDDDDDSDDDGDGDGDNNDGDEEDEGAYSDCGSSDDEMDEYDSFDSCNEEEDEVNGDTFGDLEDNEDEIREELHEHVGSDYSNSPFDDRCDRTEDPCLDDNRARCADDL